MRSQQHLYSMLQPYTRARAVAQLQEQNQHNIMMIVAYALASAIVVLWMAYLPTLAGSVMTKLNNVPTHLSSASDSINRTNKSDQFTSVRFNDRWNAIVSMTIQTLGQNEVHARVADPTKGIQRIPVGCEPAFSGLLKTGNFSARCVASADTEHPPSGV
jgi:hypothetical protein